MLDLVPLARTRRKVTDRDHQARPIGQTLQFPLPQPEARPVAPACIRRDQQRLGLSIRRATHVLPPTLDRPYREARGVVMIPTLTQPSLRCRSYPAARERLVRRQFTQTALDGRCRDTRGSGDQRRAAITDRLGLSRRPHPARSLREHGRQRCMLCPQGGQLHGRSVLLAAQQYKQLFPYRLLAMSLVLPKWGPNRFTEHPVETSLPCGRGRPCACTRRRREIGRRPRP